MKILVLNGPNLNLLGLREPGVYGEERYEDVCRFVERKAGEMGAQAAFAQSNSEGGLIDLLHGAMGVYDGVVLNAGAYTHTSYAIRTPSRPSVCRWWRCISPISTRGTSSATPRSSRRCVPARSAASGR